MNYISVLAKTMQIEDDAADAIYTATFSMERPYIYMGLNGRRVMSRFVIDDLIPFVQFINMANEDFLSE